MMTDDEKYKNKLTELAYQVTRCGDTEPAFTEKYYNDNGLGRYDCVCCQQPLFNSTEKFNSGSGWPSFFEVIAQDRVKLLSDNNFNIQRIEVRCANCDSHLGHMFDDGPQPTGKRYCINSVALEFK